MRCHLALGAALLASVAPLGVAPAQAAPTELTVRIEGATRTLFEGPILTDGHEVRAASDSPSRHCDGTNNAAHAVPGPTPTAAAADAMALVGEDFDGRWYPGFDDYLVERWGPDSEDLETGAFWGLLVNGVLTPVGGCQFSDQAGDEVLWAYDAFTGRSLLRLSAATDPSEAPAPPLPTAQVGLGQPLELVVQSYKGGEGASPEVEAAAAVTVAPVSTEAGTSYETVETSSPAAVTTDGEGKATVVFSSPGWQRLKAQDEATAVRSNRLDVCVEPIGGGDCGPLPPDAQLRVPARYQSTGSGGGSQPGPQGTDPGAVGGRVGDRVGFRLGRLRLDPRSGTATIEAIVPEAGRLTLTGARIRGVAVEARSAGKLRLKITPTAAGREILRRHGLLRVSARVGFTPHLGRTITWIRSLLLKRTAG